MSQRSTPAQADPPGFLRRDYHAAVSAASTGSTSAKNVAIYQKRAYDITQGQIFPIFQTAFMMYMFVGNQLSLFSIFFLFSMGSAPFRNLFGIQQAFAQVDVPGVQLLLPKLAYAAFNILGCAVVGWKLKSMGLLPVTSADWVALVPHRVFSEFSALGSV